MEATQIDAGEFRSGQRRDWGTAAKGWHDWQDLIYETTAPVSERLVEMAGIKPGDRVLDVAAGAGEPALTAARVAGPHGQVIATDISPEMLGHGRERAAGAGIDNIEFVETDASSLDFPPDGPTTGSRFWDELRFFDGTISQDGVITGEWLCAPLDTEQGGIVDDTVFADGSWETAEIPAARL
jgi:SAM-dependent methyltransferase